jgi:cytochrome oxidase Cu insertion factor (SCO1/SenC/PrrC family)
MRRGISFLAGTLFLLAGAASAWAEGRTGPYKVGDVVEDFSLPTVDGKTFRLSYHKGKTVVLVFFASW